MPTDFEKPASVFWSSTGLNGVPLPTNTRNFGTLREATLYVARLPYGARAIATIESGNKVYRPVDIEELEKEIGIG
jgi:hypothetical protein